MFDTLKPSTPKPTGGGLFDSLQPKSAGGGLGGGLSTAQHIAGDIVGKVGDVLNTTSRAGVGALAAGSLDPRKVAKSSLDSALSPGRYDEMTHKAEENIPVLNAIPRDFGLGENAPMYARVLRGIEDFAVQTGADPATYVPGLDLFSIAGRAGKALRGVDAVERGLSKVAESKVAKSARAVTDRFGGALDDLTDRGKSVVVGLKGRKNNRVAADQERYTQMLGEESPLRASLDDYEKQIAANDQRIKDIKAVRLPKDAEERWLAPILAERDTISPPREFRDLLLERAYREGTPHVRAAAVKAGYKPTEEEAASSPLNILHQFKTDYDPRLALSGASINDDPIIARLRQQPLLYAKRKGLGRQAFDLQQRGVEPTDSLADRLLNRLVVGSRAEHERRFVDDTERELGIVGHDDDESLRRAVLYIRPDARAVEREREVIDPVSARERAIAEQAMSGKTPVRLSYAGVKMGDQPKVIPISPRDEPPRVTAQDRMRVDQAGTLARQAELNSAGARKVAQRVADISSRQFASLHGKRIKAQDVAAREVGAGQQVVLGPRGSGAARVVTPGAQPGSRTILGPDGKPIASRDAMDAIRGPLSDISKTAFTGIAKTTRPTDALAAKASDRKVAAYNRQNAMMQRFIDKRASARAVQAVHDHAADIEKAINLAPVPERLQAYFERDRTYQRGLLAPFADLQRDALFVIPFAHLMNMTVLAAIGPRGLHVASQGAQNALKMRTEAGRAELAGKVKALEDAGATERFFSQSKHDPAYVSALQKLGGLVGQKGKQAGLAVGGALSQAADLGNSMLEAYDLGLRVALFDELKRHPKFIEKFPPNAPPTDFDVAKQVRDVLGDYANKSDLIQGLRNGLGATFPSWGLDIVPRAIAKSVKERPRRLTYGTRGITDLNQDVLEPSIQSDLDPGGPIGDFDRLTGNPLGFIASPSRSGIAGDLAGAVKAASQNKLPQYLGQRAMQAIPGSTILTSLTNNGYPSNAPAAARAGVGLAGPYFTNRLPFDKRYAQLARQGVPPQSRIDIMRREGYLPDGTP